ncbi:MAG: hypothetical protein ABJC05_10015 [Pyrinomonadaceae bacterium]
MSANASDLTKGNATAPPGPDASAEKNAAVPKKITNAQTVCNEKNEKGKLCNGHLKQLRTAGEAAEVHLRGDDVLFKCQTCGTLYMGPPLGHLRDPEKQHRFVQAELTALLQAAGGTMPVIKKNEKGVYVLAEALAGHAQAPAKPAAAPVAKPTVPIAPADSSPQADIHRPAAEAQAATGEASAAPLSPAAATASPVAGPETPADLAPDVVPASVAPPPAAAGSEAAPKPAERKASVELHRGTYAGVVDTGPVSGETHEQKIARLTKLAAAAKQKAEEGAG